MRLLLIAATALALLFAAPARADDPVTCIPVTGLTRAVQADETLARLRFVDTAMVAEAVEFFDFVTGNQPHEPFTAAMLLDIRSGGGFLFVGHLDRMCAYVIVPPEHWREVTKLLEGERV